MVVEEKLCGIKDLGNKMTIHMNNVEKNVNRKIAHTTNLVYDERKEGEKGHVLSKSQFKEAKITNGTYHL